MTCSTTSMLKPPPCKPHNRRPSRPSAPTCGVTVPSWITRPIWPTVGPLAPASWKAASYNTTMYIMAVLLVIGFVANALVRPLDDATVAAARPMAA